jgi:hypothetical protein
MMFRESWGRRRRRIELEAIRTDWAIFRQLGDYSLGTEILILKTFLPKPSATKWPFFAQITASLCKIWIIKKFLIKTPLLYRKLAKIAKNNNPKFWYYSSPPKRECVSFGKIWIGLHFGRLCHRNIGSPGIRITARV